MPFFENVIRYKINDETFIYTYVCVYIYIYIYIYIYMYVYIYMPFFRNAE